MKNQNLWDSIEAHRRRWNVLEHPFYLRWSKGELSREELAHYAGQYRYAVEGIARMSSSVADASPNGERGLLERHAAEEASHVELWDSFCAAVGGDTEAAANPETAECVDAWCARDGALPTLARLYAVESGQPAISRTKREGLRDHYGIVDGPGNDYFRIHERLDAEHAAESRALIERMPDGADAGELAGAAESAFRANWRLLDGVEQRHAAA